MQVQAASGWRDPHVRAKVIAPVADYEDYLRRRQRRFRNGHMTATKLRRAVIMARQGETWKDIAAAIGYSSGCAVKGWIDFLPLGLGI